MKKIKLLSLVLCLVLVCSLVFTACDKKPTETATQKPTETSTQTEQPTETATAPAEVEKPAVLDITTLYYYGDATENSARNSDLRTTCADTTVSSSIFMPLQETCTLKPLISERYRENLPE